MKHIETFEWQDDEKFYRWVRSISCKCVYELNRKERHTLSESDLVNDEDNSDLEAWVAKHSLKHEDIEDQVILREEMIALVRALRTLKPKECEIFTRWLMGEKPGMLAVIYGKKVDTINQLLRRARKKVKAHLSYLQSKRRGEQDDDEL